MIQIREATLTDTDAIAHLATQLGYPTTAAEAETRLKAILSSSNHTAFVAVKDEIVVGWVFVFIALGLSSDAYTEIGGLVVNEPTRGQGIGKKLVQVAEQWSKKKGILSLRVRSNVKRLETHKFYEMLGFEETKSQKVFKKSPP